MGWWCYYGQNTGRDASQRFLRLFGRGEVKKKETANSKNGYFIYDSQSATCFDIDCPYYVNYICIAFHCIRHVYTQTLHKLDIISEGTSLVASPFAEINVAQIFVGFHTHTRTNTPSLRTFMETGKTNVQTASSLTVFLPKGTRTLNFYVAILCVVCGVLGW